MFYKAGMVVTLAGPSLPGTALTPVIEEGAVEDFELSDWFHQSRENETELRMLLNSVLHRHLRRLGCEYQDKPRRYFVKKGLAEDAPLQRHWTSSRTGRSQSRTVAKYYNYGKGSFFRHQALDAKFERFGISGRSGYTLTTFHDGRNPTMGGEVARSYTIRARAEKYNDVYLNNVLFWANQISHGKGAFELLVGEQAVAKVSGVPLTAETTFSILMVAAAGHKRR